MIDECGIPFKILNGIIQHETHIFNHKYKVIKHLRLWVLLFYQLLIQELFEMLKMIKGLEQHQLPITILPYGMDRTLMVFQWEHGWWWCGIWWCIICQKVYVHRHKPPKYFCLLLFQSTHKYWPWHKKV